MSSVTVNNTAAQSTGDALTTTSGAKNDHPLSPLESPPELENSPNPTITKYQWNGDPMDWESWPTGRPGPFVSEDRMQEVKNLFKRYNGQRNEQSRTSDHILHIAEFSSSGRGEFDIYRSSSE